MPSADERWYLVSYDVRDPKRLRRAAKLVEGFGHRLQYSVFRCWMSGRSAQELRWKLTELLEPEDDVLLIPLCSRCVKGITATHSSQKAPNWPDEPDSHLIV